MASVRLTAVHCCSGEVLMEDGSIVPCSIKQVPYGTPEEQEQAQLELAALHAALGLPNLVQCLAAYKLEKTTEAASLIILTECAAALLASVDEAHYHGIQALPQASSSLHSSHRLLGAMPAGCALAKQVFCLRWQLSFSTNHWLSGAL